MADEELRAARAKAGELAAELSTLLGERPSVTWTGGGAVRVAVRVRGTDDRESTTAVLAVLARGDRFGHRRSQGREYLWLEVGGAPTTDDDW
ncbi:hypothetical protein [Kitasatospora sp. SolWspMP-SS2h]|uniref:hypothetical protein n=1 Tax=Kitasatospora sp. SolWspMP-SS2h TaxID=1305729 RepID=UPI000DBAABF3|nr:hypothetical protein [Kitasatospora sp. SolWspMP-SS2h]